MELNPLARLRVFSVAVCFNRTFMELKPNYAANGYVQGNVLIGPSWN